MQEQDIKVSVLCYTYNHEKYIAECLNGLINQNTNFKYEILVHDDASTDKTQEIIQNFANKYPDIIKPILQTENQCSKGVQLFTTYQFPRAKGKYFAICEGDDFWCDENKLQRQFDIMEQNPSLSMCFHKTENVNEDGSGQGTYFPEESISEGIIKKESILERFPYYWFHTTSFFYRRNVIEKVNYQYSDIKRSCPVGDVSAIYMGACFGNFYYIDSVMSKYRRNSIGSWSNKMNLDVSYKLRHDKRMLTFIEKYNNMLIEFFGDNHPYKNRIEYANNYFGFRILLCEKKYKTAVFSKKYRNIFRKLDKREKLAIVTKAILPIKQ